MNKPPHILLAAAMLTALPAAPALAQRASPPVSRWQPAPAELPATPAARIAAAYIEAFNAGPDSIRTFESKYRSAGGLKERPLDQRLERYKDLKARWGGLQAHSPVEESEKRIAVLARTIPAGDWIMLDFQFESVGPGGLTGIIFDGPMDPAEIQQRLEPLTNDEREETVKAAAHTLGNTYVFPETGAKMEKTLKENLVSGKYQKVASAAQLAETLTEDLRAICHDKHLRVRLGMPPGMGEPSQGPDPAFEARRNYGFVKTEVLPGNIGYLKLDGFRPGEEAKKTAASALAFLSHCDALIFDLRDNGGGSPEMIAFICGYLFEKPTLLNVFYNRNGKKVSQTRTPECIPGERFRPGLPVYVLTSSRTFSAAEEFTYDLKTTGRATIVGETTGGGAHPVAARPLGDRFIMMVPFERAENPITKTNWEGVGVDPDIGAPADKALDAAIKDAAAKTRR